MKRDIKILYVDVHLHSLNPTNTMLPNMMSCVGDVTFYGPGYVSDADLAGGILRFATRKGPFDMLVIGPNTPVLSVSDDNLRETVGYIHKWTALSPSPEATYGFFVDFLANIAEIPATHRFALLVTLDSYSTTQPQMDRLDHFDMKLIASNHHFVRRVADLPAWAKQEKHFRANAHRLSDAWYDYLAARPERVVTALHFVADSEFSFRALSERRDQVSIPGVDYVTRRDAVRSLKGSGIGVSSKLTYNIYRLLNKLRVPVYADYALLKNFNVSYFRNLIGTKYVYTAAEAFGLPVRKYFEIPAAGAILLATACNGFERIGFKPGVNCVQAEPGEIADAVSDLARDPERAQAIARAGQLLMLEQHSLRARADQIGACMEAVLQGRFAGAEWIDGEFVTGTVGAPHGQETTADASRKSERVRAL